MFSKYILVGLLNTVITVFIIFILMYWGLDVYISNVIGYSIGIIVSFIINSKFTFSTTLTTIRFIKFILNCSVCYLVNVITISIILSFSQDIIYMYISQLCGMAMYTVSGFFLNKLWVMK
ncbi:MULTISPECIES: GtrA family protein [Actinobacillus]|nr:GtrA family protein [Actinobacillus pleuropneumoniae]